MRLCIACLNAWTSDRDCEGLESYVSRIVSRPSFDSVLSVCLDISQLFCIKCQNSCLRVESEVICITTFESVNYSTTV
jgi:hypothetical protein